MKNALDTKFLGLRVNPIPIQILPLYNLRNVAQPDQPSPNMFRRMRGKDQQQVFRRRRFHIAVSNRDGHGALKQSVHIEVDSVEARLKRPLELQQIYPRGTVESAFVSRIDVVALRILGNEHAWSVAQSANRALDARYILSADEQVQVAGLPQRHVAVVHLRQDDAFVRDDIDAETSETIENTDQFAGEKKGLVNVSLITLAQRCQHSGRNDIVERREVVIEQRDEAVLVREAKGGDPIQRLRQESSNVVKIKVLHIRRACGQ